MQSTNNEKLIDNGDVESGFCSADHRGSPFTSGRGELLDVYGVQGIPTTTTSYHNKAYALGFNMMQFICWYVLFPMSVPFAFVAGMMISTCESLNEMFSHGPISRFIGHTLVII
jgi:hypothetical protein